MLLNLINDLLDLAKMENSAFNLNQSYFDLFAVIEKSAEIIDSQLQQKNIYVTHSYHQEDREFLKYMYGDQHRYLQILLNFMSNAVKFTPNGGKITVKTLLIAKQPVEERGLTDSQRDMEKRKYDDYQE
jgi:signal transduction histidine kinase